MNVYDLTKLELDPNAGGNCGAFYQNDLINARLIVLNAGQKISDARVDSYVMFYVVRGAVLLQKWQIRCAQRRPGLYIRTGVDIHENANRNEIDGCPDQGTECEVTVCLPIYYTCWLP